MSRQYRRKRPEERAPTHTRFGTPWTDQEKEQLKAFQRVGDLDGACAALPHRTARSVRAAFKRCGIRPNEDAPPAQIDGDRVRRALAQMPADTLMMGVAALLERRIDVLLEVSL